MDWIGKLTELKYNNPNRKVIFSIDSEIVADDCHSNWHAERAIVYLDKILDGNVAHEYDISLDEERCYSLDYDEEELIDMFFESYGHSYENEIPKFLEKLPWQDVIIVSVGV